jgi:SAM-dependent methyltransferase
MTESTQTAQEFWEEFYSHDQVWSERVNAQLADVAADLAPGRALDLGCGEGADAIWLAEDGWQVLAVDVSANALERAQANAEKRGVAARVRFERHDLSVTFPDGRFDLVSAQFLHSPVQIDREAMLRRAAEAVAGGGRLLVVGHAAAPPWAGEHGHEHRFDTVDEVLAGMALDDAQWERLRAETIDREALGPDGQAATLTDTLILLRRTG